MSNLVTASNLFPTHFSVGGDVPGQITINQSNTAVVAAGAPTQPPAPGAPHFYVDSSTSPRSLYHWDGSVWSLLGDGTGAGTDGNDFITTASLSPANVLTLGGSGGAGASVDLSSLAGGGSADGVVTGANLSGTNQLILTRSVGADVTVDLSSLAGGGGGVSGVTATSPVLVGGTAANPVVSIDMAALVSALCGAPAFQECIKTAAVGLIRDDGDGTFTVAHATDGVGNYVYNDCP